MPTINNNSSVRRCYIGTYRWSGGYIVYAFIEISLYDDAFNKRRADFHDKCCNNVNRFHEYLYCVYFFVSKSDLKKKSYILENSFSFVIV